MELYRIGKSRSRDTLQENTVGTPLYRHTPIQTRMEKTICILKSAVAAILLVGLAAITILCLNALPHAGYDPLSGDRREY